jgi:hypothetical protein
MPFTMTHLIIADNLSVILSKHIKNLPQFYLGNIAPDAVHNRNNYISDYKKDSHLCVGDEKWGMITNNDEWEKSVINFLNRYKEVENQDFILGYCCHILSDIYNNMTRWIPFKQKHAHEIEKYGNLPHQESNKVDIELALVHEKRKFYWLNIKQSTGVDLADIIYAAEIEKQKDNILNRWYKDKKHQDLTANKVVTIESISEFIKDAVSFVVPVLQNFFYKN